MQILEFLALVTGLFRAFRRKHLDHVVRGLPFPLADLVRVNVIFAGQLRQRQLFPQSFHRNFSLELG